MAKSYPNKPERKRLRIAGDWAFFNEAFTVDEEKKWEQEEEEYALYEEEAGYLRGGGCSGCLRSPINQWFHDRVELELE